MDGIRRACAVVKRQGHLIVKAGFAVIFRQEGIDEGIRLSLGEGDLGRYVCRHWGQIAAIMRDNVRRSQGSEGAKPEHCCPLSSLLPTISFPGRRQKRWIVI